MAIPFSTKDEGVNYPQQAINAVARVYAEYFDKQEHYADKYVVWFCYILGGWKALVSTSLPDGRYYEVTYNNNRGVAFVDCYEKTDNVEIDWND